MARAKVREVETHHNQKLTQGAASHSQSGAPEKVKGTKQKVVVLRLSDAEYEAFKTRGGAKAFKSWLSETEA